MSHVFRVNGVDLNDFVRPISGELAGRRLRKSLPSESAPDVLAPAYLPLDWEDQIGDALEDSEVFDPGDWIRARDIVIDKLRSWGAKPG